MKHTGTWIIEEMEAWDYTDAEEKVHLTIKRDGTGHFQFDLIQGLIDGAVWKEAGSDLFIFSWEGNDEDHPALGCGWLALTGPDRARGGFNLHLGDRSAFKAKRE